jgi:hypothetical protein
MKAPERPVAETPAQPNEQSFFATFCSQKVALLSS